MVESLRHRREARHPRTYHVRSSSYSGAEGFEPSTAGLGTRCPIQTRLRALHPSDSTTVSPLPSNRFFEERGGFGVDPSSSARG